MKKTKSITKLKKELQGLFNAYIRQRDEGMSCISCGSNQANQAGHYFPVKNYDSLRFNEDNCWLQCSGCNCFNHGNLIYYTINLKKKLGEEGYNELKNKAEDYKNNGYKWTRYELEEKINHYKNLLK